MDISNALTLVGVLIMATSFAAARWWGPLNTTSSQRVDNYFHEKPSEIQEQSDE